MTSVARSLGPPLDLGDLVRYAGASGDFNPLHYDQAFARKAGFDDVIVMGALTAGVLAGLLVEEHGPLGAYHVRYRRPVPLGAELIASLTTEDDRVRAEVRLRGDGEPVVTATARFDGAAAGLETLPPEFEQLGEPYPWPVEQGAAAAFAAAVRQPGGRPLLGDPAPPTFVVSALRWTPEQRNVIDRLDLDPSRMLHGHSVFEYGARPPRVGDRLWVTEGHSGRSTVRGRSGLMTVADAHLIVRDDEGAVRVRVAHRMIERPGT